MSLEFAVRKKTFWLALPTGVFYLCRNRYLSATTVFVVIFSVGAPILYYLIFIPQTLKPSALVILTSSTFGLYCLSYLALVLKVEFPAVYAKKSDRRWFFESCAFLSYAFGVYVVVNLELIRDLFISKQYLYGNVWIGGFISLLPFVGVVIFRVRQLIVNIHKQ